MPRITFTAFVQEKPKGGLEPLHSVPMPSGKKAPEGRFLAWYGNRTAWELLHATLEEASKRKYFGYRVNLVLDGGDFSPTKQRMNHVRNLKVLHLDRLPLETREELARLVGGSGRHSKDIAEMVKARPSLVNELWALPKLKHLSAIIFPVPDDEKQIWSIGAIRPNRIESVKIDNYEGSDQLVIEI